MAASSTARALAPRSTRSGITSPRSIACSTVLRGSSATKAASSARGVWPPGGEAGLSVYAVLA
jgi:hypothetical protein